MALKIQINIKNPRAFENNYRGDILRIPAPKFGCPLSRRYAETEQAWLECYEKSKHDLVKRVEKALKTSNKIFEITALQENIIFKTPQNPWIGTYKPEWAFQDVKGVGD